MIYPNYFPYPYRPGQEEMLRLIRGSVRDGKNLVVESGTGTGKTSVSLCAAMEANIGCRRKVIFLTRTKSQQRQIALESRAISSRFEHVCVSIQGRGPSTCPMMEGDKELMDGTSEELSKLCSVLKKGNTDAGRCAFYDRLDVEMMEACVSFVRSLHPDFEEFREFCSAAGICPYEASKRLLQYADVVSAPYAFFFIPGIHKHFFEWMGISEHEAIIILDEAHNLPSYLRETQSCRITLRSLNLAACESDENGNPDVYQGITVSDIVQLVSDAMNEAREMYLHRDNDLLPPGFLQEEMMGRLGMTSSDILSLLANMVSLGESIASQKKVVRRLPRSHILTLARFLMRWVSCTDGSYVFLIVGGENPALEAYCLDPSDTAETLNLCHSTISMSGTLNPLDLYSKELDLYEPELMSFSSPFPKENLSVGYVRDVSTRYEDLHGEDDTVYERLKDYVIRLVNCVHKNTAVFFPSYKLMERFINDNVPAILNREIYFERSEMPQAELMEQMMDFRCNEGSVLFAVTGGRISEGLDFPGKELELAIIVGIPFSRPSAKQDALISYNQNRFGRGWDMAVKIPAIRKMRQAIGRLIRSEKDRGMAVILDRRVPMLGGIEAKYLEDPVNSVKDFFEQQ